MMAGVCIGADTVIQRATQPERLTRPITSIRCLTNSLENSMNAINANIDRGTLITIGNELTTSSGIRAVSAWLALCEPDVTYALDDDDAPYEFRHVVGIDIGFEMACEDLDPNGDIPRYLDYMNLHQGYGTEWPVHALVDYFEVVKEMKRKHAKAAAQVIWRSAIERYEEWRESMQNEEADEFEEAAA